MSLSMLLENWMTKERTLLQVIIDHLSAPSCLLSLYAIIQKENVKGIALMKVGSEVPSGHVCVDFD